MAFRSVPVVTTELTTAVLQEMEIYFNTSTAETIFLWGCGLSIDEIKQLARLRAANPVRPFI